MCRCLRIINLQAKKINSVQNKHIIAVVAGVRSEWGGTRLFERSLGWRPTLGTHSSLMHHTPRHQRTFWGVLGVRGLELGRVLSYSGMWQLHTVEYRAVGGVHDHSVVCPGFESGSNHPFFVLRFGAQKLTFHASSKPISMYISVSVHLQNR